MLGLFNEHGRSFPRLAPSARLSPHSLNFRSRYAVRWVAKCKPSRVRGCEGGQFCSRAETHIVMGICFPGSIDAVKVTAVAAHDLQRIAHSPRTGQGLIPSSRRSRAAKGTAIVKLGRSNYARQGMRISLLLYQSDLLRQLQRRLRGSV